MRPRRLHARISALAAALAILSGSPSAEVSLDLYLGDAATRDADVRLRLPDGADRVFGDVGWRSDSFEGPLYYGLRVNRWLDRAPAWGLTVELTHAKMFAELDAAETLDATFEELSFSHGHNLLTLNGRRRFRPSARARPYAGLGLGVALPHVEVVTSDSLTYGYQLAGPAAQAFCGVEVSLGRRLSWLAEYKLTRAEIEADLDGGGLLRVEPWTHHFVVGVSVRFGHSP